MPCPSCPARRALGVVPRASSPERRPPSVVPGGRGRGGADLAGSAVGPRSPLGELGARSLARSLVMGDPGCQDAGRRLAELDARSRLAKAWLLGIHHGVSPQHLQAYLNEFTFRFNRRFYPFNSFRSILGIGANTESLTYAELYDADCKHPSFTDVAFVGES